MFLLPHSGDHALMHGYFEALSCAYASGWCQHIGGAGAYIYARLGTEILGSARASEERLDLQELAQRDGIKAGGFFLLFNRVLAPGELADVEIHAIDGKAPLPRLPNIRIDRLPVRRVFIFGSPRSGTSRLGETLASVLELPWLGELHGAPLFAQPAALLQNGAVTGALRSHLAAHPPALELQDMLRRTYFRVHNSASFLDKTPGIPMIRAAPFLAQCFPDAKFVYLRRNGVANVRSRMAKFSGDFLAHCSDWAGALQAWSEVADALPHSLELQQEQMLAQPTGTAAAIAAYLGAPEYADAIAQSLSDGSPERTGAGLGSERLSDTGWSLEQQASFLRLCGPTMQRFGYTF